jgi:hypothetical protein
MDQKRQIEVLNEATNKALSQIRKKRKDDNKIDMTIREIILMLNIIDTKLRLYYTNSANEDGKKGYIICTT